MWERIAVTPLAIAVCKARRTVCWMSALVRVTLYSRQIVIASHNVPLRLWVGT